MSKLKSLSEEGKIRLRVEREKYIMIEKEIILSNYNFPKVPSKDGYYHMMVPDHKVKNGRKHFKARTVADLQEKVYWHAKGIAGYASRTFYDVFALTQEELLKYVKSADKRMSVMNTVSRHWQDYNRYFAGTDFERMMITDISKNDIEAIILANLSKYDLRKRAFVNMTSLLSSCFKLAYQQEWTQKNTFDLINVKDSRFVNMLVEGVDIQERIYTDEEMRLIKSEINRKHVAVPSYLPAYALEIQIMLGLRRAEVCALKFSDIAEDTKSGVLCITICRELLTVKKSSVNKKEFSKVVEHTKTNKNRKIPVSEALRKLLLEIVEVHKKYNITSEFMFPAKNEVGCISIYSVYNYYRRICKKVGIQIQADIIRGPHAFRRNAAERISNAGGDAEMAARLLGNTPKVLRTNYYDGLNMSLAKDILNSAEPLSSGNKSTVIESAQHLEAFLA